MNDLVPIEDGQQALHRSRRVARPGLNVFAQHAPGVLNGPKEGILVRIIHDARNP